MRREEPVGDGPVPIGRGTMSLSTPRISQGVAVTCRCRIYGLRFLVAKPRIVLDGRELQQVRWGRIELALPAGTHTIQMSMATATNRWADLAEATVKVEPDQVVELDYFLPQRTSYPAFITDAVTYEDVKYAYWALVIPGAILACFVLLALWLL